ncbi:MAG TPA: nucleoside-diphosphate sugar epimerase/dehydratase [Kiritimatiellia bacterium]|nr:nucleoside-diphosphate sugar epimerase/dehydratase [Kiritimatiellia bacterium]
MPFPKQIITWRRPLIIALHMGLAALIYFLAFLIRFDLSLDHRFHLAFWQTLPYAILIKVLALGYFGLHRGLWRYASLNDLWSIIKACVIAAILLTVAIAFYPGFRGFPRSVILIDLGLSILVFGGKRFSIRLIREFLDSRSAIGKDARRILIAGAGAAGIMAMKELKANRSRNCHIVGFLDDDPYKKGMLLDGHRVLGPLSEAPQWIESFEADELLLAMPSAPKRVGRELVEACRGLDIKLRTLPPLSDLLSGRLRVSAIHDIQLEDLLGRDPIALDREAVTRIMHDATVLVTGAGGSIGSEICRQIAACRPRALVLLDIAETPLFHIEHELRAAHPGLDIVPLLADVRDSDEISTLFNLHRPRYVFHAAAYKHVPVLEQRPSEAILNNILGTRNVAQASARAGVEKFLLISTDKAVRPTSIMGATKRCAEWIIQNMNQGHTAFFAVRFGNVLGSNGSVVPLFKRQIEAGGPITLTHRDVTRYFMTIPEAVELVLQAMRIGTPRDIYILDMGNPIRILDLAHQMIQLAGFVPEEDIAITEVGLRPGEKLHEELATHEADLLPSDVPKIRKLIPRNDPSLPPLDPQLDQLILLARNRDATNAALRLHEIIRLRETQA